ncbi:MAG TPA: 3-hydroxybutyrate oligomer hydrolase family protein [Myxococcales bacterium]|nr:3-hydroxybutyrate oligomer hydrolase family protein [Myxococcales bacterium]
MSKRVLPLFLAFAACHGGSDVNELPSFVAKGSISTIAYDGNNDDLLTGGLGASGLISSTPPSVSTPPTASELRRRAIYTNYRAVLDATLNGGFGTLYGPNVDVNGNPQLTQGKIAGEEWLAYDDDGTGRVNATLMVQLPSSFDPDNPCIVTGSSPGSRNVYGAIATAGEWGLKHGCAVAYTDKGTGSGVHDLANDTVNLRDGTRQDAGAAGTASNFTAGLSASDRAAYNQAFPNRFAIKHAHSQLNPEEDWGRYTLHAVELAYYVLNQKFGTAQSDAGNAAIARKYHPGQILTIAASTSSGAGAALAAAEQDPQHYISGVVAAEPQIQMAFTGSIQRNGVPVQAKAKTFYDSVTLAMLYQGCAPKAAGVAKELRDPFLAGTQIDARCNALTSKGLLSSGPGQANEALQRLLQAGFEDEATDLYASYFATYTTTSIALTQASSYARASVKDNLCGYSFAVVDSSTSGVPVAPGTVSANASGLAQIFGNGSGLPPTFPLEIINNNSVGGPKRDQLSTSASTGVADFNIDGAACLRSLWTGVDGSGSPLTGDLLAQSRTLKGSIQQTLRGGRLRGIPAILLQGRNDPLVPVNHASRAYLAANKMAEGANSPTVYYEVTNAQHFDAFIAAYPSYQTRFVPLHRYVIQALDLMYAHLKSGAALPPSQVVRTTPRSSTTTTINGSNVPAVSPNPAAADQITFSNGTLNVPD